jgi:hypothetical protein
MGRECTPPLTRLGCISHHDGNYAKKWPLPVYLHSLVCWREPPTSPGWADFTIMMECMPESGHCHSSCIQHAHRRESILSRLWACTPTFTRLGWYYHHDGMYTRRPLYQSICTLSSVGMQTHLHQAGLNLPSWWNVRQKVAIAILCVLSRLWLGTCTT